MARQGSGPRRTGSGCRKGDRLQSAAPDRSDSNAGNDRQNRGDFSRRFFVKKFREKIRAESAGAADSRPAGTTGKASRKSPAKNSVESGGKIAGGGYAGGRLERGPKSCRTAATACRIAAPRGFMRAVSSLYPVYLRPPIAPPRPCKSRPPSLQNPQPAPPAQQAGTTAGSIGHQSDSHSRPGRTAQSHQHSHQARATATQPAPQATPQPASTTAGRQDRRADHGDRSDDDHRPGPEGRRYSRRGL